MNLRPILLSSIALLIALPTSASAQDRYVIRPPVVVSPDLSAPWVLQLGQQPGPVVRQRVIRQQPRRTAQQPRRLVRQQRRNEVQVQALPENYQTAGVPLMRPKPVAPQMDPIYLPREVEYDSNQKPGTIIIDSSERFLYYIRGNGKARRYGVGVGKEDMGWTGTEIISRKAQWPEWRPPAEMIARERAKGRILPAMMAGGESNPLGARALYLGSTLYRIHGTNAPWTIGTQASSGCIRMRNQDVIELYDMVGVGTKVVVM
jgi:lipoprotein-anchoring transpeptidase ErfK/SrfK